MSDKDTNILEEMEEDFDTANVIEIDEEVLAAASTDTADEWPVPLDEDVIEEEPVVEKPAKKSKAAKKEEPVEEPEETVIDICKADYKVHPSIINRLLEGGYGRGHRQIVGLKASGLDPIYVQNALDQLIKEVKDGKWGNEVLRYRKLREAGYDAVLVRRAVLKKR